LHFGNESMTASPFGGRGGCERRVVMTLHKLTAGDGYTYLTRQVAAHDATQRGYDGLGDYYAQKGETPGIWMGTGVSRLPHFLDDGADLTVTEAQMTALFGEGRHPDAERIEREMRAAGHGTPAILAATRLGSPYAIYSGVSEFRRRVADAFEDFNAELGFPRSWPVPAEERAAIRTKVARTMFAAEFDREPVDARELSGYVARASRQSTTAVAGYDLTFSPVKSVSALWAIGDHEVVQVIEQAHQDAVADTLGWLERNAAYTRNGRNGAQQIETTGLIAAAFTHRDSRAGDPDLHTHVAISNKVQSARDGRWLALDGRPLHKMTVAASERYNTRLETLLRDRLGIQFADRPADETGKRPVREIVGIEAGLLSRWSRRRARIDERRAELSARFQTSHGRTPTAVESIQLAQQANLETRPPKHAPRSIAEQRATWRAEAVDTLGGQQALAHTLRTVLGRRPGGPRQQEITPAWVEMTGVEVLDAMQARRATWQECHVRAEAERKARAAGVPASHVDQAVDAIVSTVLSPANSIPLGAPDPVSEPAELRRSDGSSVYAAVGTQLFTSSAVVAAEAQLLATAGRYGARVIADAAIDIALLESTANGVELNPGQVQLVRELARSGARLQLALAPAGTGKTTAMRVLADAWRTPAPAPEDGHQESIDQPGHVLGLAPSATAAALLREEIGVHTDTLAKLIHSIESSASDQPTWVAAIGSNTLAIIDEAGMAGTTDLARAVEFITNRGGSVRLVGDDQQLASIGAGGVLRDIADTFGAVHLSQVVRFTDPAEGAASLGLRAGDHAALGYYIDQHRVHVGDQATATDAAYRAWSADRVAGRDAVMLAPTRELVAHLNDRARVDRLVAATAVSGPDVRLIDGSRASASDVIITRQNDRRLPITATDWVKNGDRFTVEQARPDGALLVRHHGTGRTVVLPATYVREHVALGYAATVHAAQGITADASHVVATGDESRQLLYVALTRGRDSNHVYLATAGDGDPHAVIERDSLLPPTAVDVLARILDRDGAQTSATSAQRELTAPATRLRACADRYHDALHTAAESHVGAHALAAIAAAAEQALPGLTSAPAWPTLRSHLALLAAADHDPASALRKAIAVRDLSNATDLAAVLDWRLDPTRRRGGTGPHTGGPLPWLPSIPPRLAADVHWGDYLTRRAELVADMAAQVAADTHDWQPSSAPRWAAGLLDRATDPHLLADLAVWRAALEVADSDRSLTGIPQKSAAQARHQRHLNQRIQRTLGDPVAATHQWRQLAEGIDARLTGDPYWPVLAERLSAAHRAGIDIPVLCTAVADTGGPLPDEYPSAALWWRLSRQLSPATLTADATTASTLRPAWTPQLGGIVGEQAIARILADPSWPALVAAVAHATEHGWHPASLLSTAFELLDSGHPDDEALRPEEMATALVWRIGMLTDTPSEITLEPDFDVPVDEVESSPAPPDLTAFGDVGAELDEHWLSSLQPPATADHAPTLAPEDDAVTWVAGESDHDAQYAYPAAAGVATARLLELNTQALAYFTGLYEQSWASAYIAQRLGTDAVTHPWFTPGFAPPGWSHLVDHLHRRGATDDELLAAGLATRARTGRLIDRFRDRLILPIYHNDQIHGFIGRRNPANDEADDAGPKYLNTAETDVFSKGAQLFGLHEARDLLAAGAIPVLVEGPLDAMAVTIAGAGDYVGVAPLGTAFTDRQADQLRPWIGDDRRGVIVATDADRAGQRAAERAFWQLTARRENPRHLVMPDGLDPAELLRTGGAGQLQDALTEAGPLATSLISGRVDRYAGRLDTPDGRVAAARSAAEVIGALPPEHWLEHIAVLDEQLGAAPGLVHLEVLDAGHAWTLDPDGRARRHLADRVPVDAPAPVRWAALGRRIRPDLITGNDWNGLAEALDAAVVAGYDVAARLPDLAATAALPYRQPARELHARLVADCPAAATGAGSDLLLAEGRAVPRAARTGLPREPAIADNRRNREDRAVDPAHKRVFRPGPPAHDPATMNEPRRAPRR
jgi:DNA primase catalytic core